MKKKKITIKQKIGLIFLGVFIALVLLEFSLRVGGYVLMSKQRTKNIIEADDEYVILCLGESTTADMYNGENSWPDELQKILNEKSPEMRFKVINEGMIGIITSEVLENLEGNLEQYKPDMVVTMIGVNDGWTRVSYDNLSKTRLKLFFENIRTYKLGKLLVLHWSEKINIFYEKNMKSKKESSKSYQEYIDLGWKYDKKEEYKEAEDAFKKAIELDPKDYVAYIGLGWSYRNQLNIEKAEEAFNKAIELYPKDDGAYEGLAWVYNEKRKPELAESMLKKAIEINPKSYGAYIGLGWSYRNQLNIEKAEEAFNKAIELYPKKGGAYDSAYEGLAWVYNQKGEPELAESMLKKAIEINPNNSMTYVELGVLYKNQEEFDKAKDILKRAVKINPINERAYKILLEVYKNLSMEEEAKESYEKVLQIRMNYYNPILLSNYQTLYNTLEENGIRLFVMQYPLRDVQEFRNFFDEKQQKDIIFIENKENFEKALENLSYDDLFIDRFAGDFGHCTLEGNKLIAENVAKILLE